MLNQEGLKNALSRSKLNFKIDFKKVDLVWTISVDENDQPLLLAEIIFDDKLVPDGKVVCPNGLDDDLKLKAEKFVETLGLIILLRTQKIKTLDGKVATSGQFDNDTDFYKKILLVYEDICSKY